MIIVIPDERPISWNQLYSGMHWSGRAKLAREKHLLVRCYLDPDIDPYEEPVSITVRAFFGDKPQDADNICDKLYIDGLCGYVIHDDSSTHVVSTTTESYVDEDNPRVEIEVVPY